MSVFWRHLFEFTCVCMCVCVCVCLFVFWVCIHVCACMFSQPEPAPASFLNILSMQFASPGGRLSPPTRVCLGQCRCWLRRVIVWYPLHTGTCIRDAFVLVLLVSRALRGDACCTVCCLTCWCHCYALPLPVGFIYCLVWRPSVRACFNQYCLPPFKFIIPGLGLESSHTHTEMDNLMWPDL